MSNPGGRPTTVTDEQILQYLRESDERVLSTPEVAEALDISRRTALRRLSDLDDEGRVDRKDVGGRATVWWAIEDDSESTAPAAPLRGLVGGLDPEAAAEARERSETWREEFDEELAGDEA